MSYKFSGTLQVVDTLKFSKIRPYEVPGKNYLFSNKSVFDRVVCDNDDELRFATFLEGATIIASFIKNQVRNQFFSIEYVKASGDLSYYYPDFVVKTSDGNVWIIETKGNEDVDVLPECANE